MCLVWILLGCNHQSFLMLTNWLLCLVHTVRLLSQRIKETGKYPNIHLYEAWTEKFRVYFTTFPAWGSRLEMKKNKKQIMNISSVYPNKQSALVTFCPLCGLNTQKDPRHSAAAPPRHLQWHFLYSRWKARQLLTWTSLLNPNIHTSTVSCEWLRSILSLLQLQPAAAEGDTSQRAEGG